MNRLSEQSGSPRRSLFFRLWLRSLTVKRPQAALGFAAVLVGAALAAALLNLHDGVRRKMTQEFRGFGANALVSAAGETNGGSQVTLGEKDIMAGLAEWKNRTSGAVTVPRLHVVMRLRPSKADERLPEFLNVVVVGTDFGALHALYPGWRLSSDVKPLAVGAQHAAPLPQESTAGAHRAAPLYQSDCVVGTRLARALRLLPGSQVSIEPQPEAAAAQGSNVGARRAVPSSVGGTRESGVRAHRDAPLQCRISGILSTGSAEDDQVFVPLAGLQQKAALEGRLSVVEILIPGDTAEVARTVEELSRAFPSTRVRPVRAIVESQGRVIATIGWLLVSMTSLIVVIVALCVMATMTAIVLERKKDVAVMKALGATDRLIMRLFLCEGAGLGLMGGLAGFGLGLVLARELGRSLFGVPLNLSWWTLPLVSLGSVLVAVLATVFPVRSARSIQPATTLKGA